MRRSFCLLPTLMLVVGSAAAGAEAPLYYQDASGKPSYSATPRKDAAGRDFVGVYTDASPPPAPPASIASPAAADPGKILYYRNPMGLPDASPVPKKDSMGMDYVPIYAGDAADAGTVKISLGRIQQLGVRTELVTKRAMTRAIRAVGTVAVDERRVVVVAPRFEGWIEKLPVNTTGQPVRKGEVLADVYAPDLMQAQQEYLIARDTAGGDNVHSRNADAMSDAVLSRLRNLDVSADQLTRLQGKGGGRRTFALTAPIDGVVMEKIAVQGLHFASGDMLYRIADLSIVWVLADIFEQDLGLIQTGQDANIIVPAYPGRAFAGKVAFIYPTINRETRTAKIRIEIGNADLALKADMYATAEIAAPVTAQLVAVPDSAVLDSGARQVVLIERGEGRFEPRTVKVGRKAGGYVEIREGVAAGEKVVVGANFLIDAESNLRSALQTFTAPAQAARP
jgi:Cu(I)/Ag(I) efflux system membrane fusion protein